MICRIYIYMLICITFILILLISMPLSESYRMKNISGDSGSGRRYDPEIYEKSGGMASYSSTFRDTSPEGGGFINYPYEEPVPWWFNKPRYWRTYINRYPHYMDTLREHINAYSKNGYFPQSLIRSQGHHGRRPQGHHGHRPQGHHGRRPHGNRGRRPHGRISNGHRGRG